MAMGTPSSILSDVLRPRDGDDVDEDPDDVDDDDDDDNDDNDDNDDKGDDIAGALVEAAVIWLAAELSEVVWAAKVVDGCTWWIVGRKDWPGRSS